MSRTRSGRSYSCRFTSDTKNSSRATPLSASCGGAKKQKETVGGLIRSIKALRDHFGKVYVNIAEPIELEPMLDRLHPDWRDYESENGERPSWLAAIVDELGTEIMQNINSAAAVTPISLLAYVLAGDTEADYRSDELRRQLELSLIC